jgi:hypothetical protein
MNAGPDNTDQSQPQAPTRPAAGASEVEARQFVWSPSPAALSAALSSINIGDIAVAALPSSMPDVTAFGAQFSGVAHVMEAIEGIQPPRGMLNIVGGFNRELERHASALAGVAAAIESVRAPMFDFDKYLNDKLAGLWSPPSSALDHLNLGGPISGITRFVAAVDAIKPPPGWLDSVTGFTRELERHASGLADVAAALHSAHQVAFGIDHRVDELMNRMWSRISPPMDALNLGFDLSQFSAVTNVMNSLESARGPLFDVTTLASKAWAGMNHHLFVDRMMGGHTEALIEALQGWSARADRGLWAARIALRLALRAKKAVERGDLDAVKQFMRDWLGFTIFPFDLITSASLVLLDVSRWLPRGAPPLSFDPSPKLRALTLAEHRRLTRSLTEDPANPALRLNGQSLLSLDKPRKVIDGDYRTLNDMRPDAGTPDPGDVLAENVIDDPRVLRVWWKFTDRERAILYEKGQPGTTWPAAAVAIGATPGEGDRLARKVRYLNKGAAEPTTPTEAAG